MPIPADDPTRSLTAVSPDDAGLAHIGLVGDTYTVLITGSQTGGRYCLIDMLVPPGGGPGPHRHDFEELFTVLEGEVQFTFRAEQVTAHAGQSVNIPANAPHLFHNASERPVRMLCMCSPAGQEDFFAAAGDAVETRTSPAPALEGDARQERLARIAELAPSYRTEVIRP